MDVFRKFSNFFFLVTVIASLINAEDICVTKSPCICEFSNGTGIDLTKSAKSTFYTTQYYDQRNDGAEYVFVTFYYHPCTDILLNVTATPGCTVPLAMCQYQSKMSLVANTTFKLDPGSYDFIGNSVSSNFSADGRSIIYQHGPSSTQVLLTCAYTNESIQVYDITDPHRMVLSFFSRHACLTQLEQPGRSVGSTLCIIFFSFVIFYLVLGICTKKFLMGATGIEVIPNLGFWSDLPNLVKDGWAFAISGFKLTTRGAGPATSPDPNSYDSI